ncbi:MAG: hypothetical protein FWG10_12220 [Eubacteriaceae bacterium]|nr:hypothetical protein [Eubacteriaceae bacterium]
MKKTILAILFVVWFMGLLHPAAIRADVLFEPDNSFYSRNAKDCVSLNRSYYANGSEGYIILLNEPKGNHDVAILTNGKSIYIMFTYVSNGKLWGITEFYDDSGRTLSGWVLMSELYAKYDYIEFEHEYGSQFYAYVGEGAVGEIVLWTWPGSGDVRRVFNTANNGNSPLVPYQVYKDPDGREWGFIGYLYGSHNVWFCLSDPSNQNLPAFHPAPEPALVAAASEGSLPKLRSGFSATILVIVLVVAVVSATALLVRKRWKPAGSKASK